MLRMSVLNAVGRLQRSLSGRWQVPLLGLSIVLLGVAFYHARPPGPVRTFQQRFDQILALQHGGFYPEASQAVQAVFEADEDLNASQRGALYRALAQTIFLAERSREHHDPENAKRVIRNHRRALADGLTGTAEVHAQIGKAFRWIGRDDDAIDAYRKAISAGGEDSGRLRREIIEMLREAGRITPKALSAELTAILADRAVDGSDLLWAVEQQMDVLARHDKPDEMGRLLDRVGPRLSEAGLSDHLQYLQALRYHLAGNFDQAERFLLSLLSRIGDHEDLAAKGSWLLGRIHFADGRPQEALVCFRNVVDAHAAGEFTLACRLGMAECLAALHYTEESASLYEKVAGLSVRYPDGGIVDRDAVRASLVSQYAMLRSRGELGAAARFLRLAVGLVRPHDEVMTTKYYRWLADLYVSLGEIRLDRDRRVAETRGVALASSRPTTLPATRPTEGFATARDAFAEAAEVYLRLVHLLAIDADASMEAAWLAADQFDRANMPERMIAVLEDALTEHSRNPRAPDALYRLGQAYQSLGRYEKAIERYEDNQRRFPRTPAAMRSMVPTAQCYVALGPEFYPQAEKALLAVVEQPTARGRYDPEALEYRESLFVLGDLYDRWGRSGKAISRMEEFLERYPRDPRVVQVQFILANAYRKSGLALLGAAKTSGKTGAAGMDGPARLSRSGALFSEVIRELDARPAGSLSQIERLHLKYSHLYAADCAFDQEQYEDAVALYEQVCRRFRKDPISLSAYVQILNCHQRAGKDGEARAVLQRIGWSLKTIPPERFEAMPGGQGLAQWRGFVDWIEESGLF